MRQMLRLRAVTIVPAPPTLRPTTGAAAPRPAPTVAGQRTADLCGVRASCLPMPGPGPADPLGGVVDGAPHGCGGAVVVMASRQVAQDGAKTLSRRGVRRLPALGFFAGGVINYLGFRALGKKASRFYDRLREERP